MVPRNISYGNGVEGARFCHEAIEEIHEYLYGVHQEYVGPRLLNTRDKLGIKYTSRLLSYLEKQVTAAAIKSMLFCIYLRKFICTMFCNLFIN